MPEPKITVDVAGLDEVKATIEALLTENAELRDLHEASTRLHANAEHFLAEARAENAGLREALEASESWLGWRFDETGRLLVENCANIAELTVKPPRICANCGQPVKAARTSTGWTHIGRWLGVRCEGAITGARIAEGSTDG